MDAFGDDDRLLAYVENARGHVHGIAGELEPEIEAHERMLAAVERAHGPDTEPVAVALSGLAIAAYRQGDYARTANLASKALEIIERELGPGHPRVASVALTVSGALMSVGRYAEATNMAERARDVALEVYGNEHPTYITIVMNLGTIASYEGRYDVAEMHLRQALAGWVELRGEGDPSVATTRANLGIALHHLDRLEEAREQLYLARQIWTDKFGPEHPRTVFARVALADVAVDEGHAAQAADDLEVCLRVQSETETDPSDIGMTQFALARALWAMDADRDRALELAKAALDSAQDVPGHGLQAQRIQRWLALVRP
jgi:tetratricopeptide (TPR) repeat protein